MLAEVGEIAATLSRAYDFVRGRVSEGAGRVIGGELPDVITQEWWEENWGDPRIFYWTLDVLDLAFLPKSLAWAGANVVGGAALSNLIDRYSPGQPGSKDDMLELTDPYVPVGTPLQFRPSISKLKQHGYIRVNGVVLQRSFYERAKADRTVRPGVISMTPSSAYRKVTTKIFDWLKTPPEKQIMNREKFVNQVVPVAYAEATRRGYVNPSLPVIQMHVESAGGRAVSAKNNYAGIKAFKGGQAGSAVGTFEVVNGARKDIKDRFAVFETPEEFVSWYFDFLDRRFPAAKQATTPMEWVTALRFGKPMGYATALPEVYASHMTRQAAEVLAYSQTNATQVT